MAQGGEQIVKLDLVRKMFLSVETNVSRLCALIDGGRGRGGGEQRRPRMARSNIKSGSRGHIALVNQKALQFPPRPRGCKSVPFRIRRAEWSLRGMKQFT